MTSTNDLRLTLRRMWSSVADQWAEHADEVDTARAEVTVAMLERAGLRPGDRVLELAGGPGGVGRRSSRRSSATHVRRSARC